MNDRKQDTQKDSKTPRDRRLALGLAVLALIMILYFVAVHLPSYITYRESTFCKKAESDAKVVATALADYFTIPNHTTTPTFEQLRIWASVTLSGNNTATITITDLNEPIIIAVTDGSGKCPVAYQDAMPDWDGNDVYKLTMPDRQTTQVSAEKQEEQATTSKQPTKFKISLASNYMELKKVLPVDIKPTTFEFRGIVTKVYDVGETKLRNYFHLGDTFQGYYSFDAEKEDRDTKIGSGWYHKPYFDNPESFVVIFKKNPVDLMFKLAVPMHGYNVYSISVHTNSSTVYDNYSFKAGLYGHKIGNLNIDSISWRNSCLMSKESLPTDPPVLGKNLGSFGFRPCREQSLGGRCPVVIFELTSLSKID